MSDGTQPLSLCLKEATRDLHQHAESRTLQRQMFRGEIERERFAAYLGQLFLVHQALEEALARVVDERPEVAAVAGPDRRHVGRLRRDLKHHGVAPDLVEACPATVDLLVAIRRRERDEPLSLLGALYVLEGSTNGSKVLARVLTRAWRSDGAGLAYLDPYGDDQPARWAAFKRDIDRVQLDQRSREAVVDAAREAFRAISEISDQVASPPPARELGPGRRTVA